MNLDRPEPEEVEHIVTLKHPRKLGAAAIERIVFDQSKIQAAIDSGAARLLECSKKDPHERLAVFYDQATSILTGLPLTFIQRLQHPDNVAVLLMAAGYIDRFYDIDWKREAGKSQEERASNRLACYGLK